MREKNKNKNERNKCPAGMKTLSGMELIGTLSQLKSTFVHIRVERGSEIWLGCFT